MPASNRAILLTPPGAAAIAVVRLRGPLVPEFLARHFSRPARNSRCVHGELRDDHLRLIDDPLVVLHDHELSADIHVHGGPWVVQACFELARARGFEVMDRPMFPLPINAVDGIDPIERSMLASLPLATTELALTALLAQPQAWRTVLAGPRWRDVLRAIVDDRALWWLLHSPRVAIVGVPNVGKSTLANQLFAQHRSITADVPGTTRDWVGELANLDGLAVMLLDTPGVRDSDDPIERTAISRARQQVSTADLVIIVLDAARPLNEQADILAAHPEGLRIVNKIDCRHAWDVDDSHLRMIATTGTGIDELRRSIRRFFGCDGLDPQRPRCWTQQQRDALIRAIEQDDGLQLQGFFEP